jgi:DNA-binding CsgD family transcriptional regulator
VPHATLIVFILSLAAGLAGISLQYELYRRYDRDYLGAGVRQLVFFNSVLLIQLLYSYYTLNLSPTGGASVQLTIAYLTVSSPLKLFWVVTLGIMVVNLLGITISPRIRSVLRIGAVGLYSGMAALGIVGLRTTDPRPLFQVQSVVELLVVAGIVLICLFLFARYRGIRVEVERRLARDFGLILLGIWVPVIVSILLGSRLWPGSGEFRLLIHSLLILGFNLAPCLLFRRRLPELLQFKGEMEPDWESLTDRYGITRRECEILELICRGRKNQEIADELFISLQTVKDHNHRIFRKLGVKSRVQAANIVRGDLT